MNPLSLVVYGLLGYAVWWALAAYRAASQQAARQSKRNFTRFLDN